MLLKEDYNTPILSMIIIKESIRDYKEEIKYLLTKGTFEDITSDRLTKIKLHIKEFQNDLKTLKINLN